MNAAAAYPLDLVGAEAVKVGYDVKLDVGPGGVIQRPRLVGLAKLQARQQAVAVTQTQMHASRQLPGFAEDEAGAGSLLQCNWAFRGDYA